MSYPLEIEQWWVDRLFRFYRTKDERAAIKRLVPAAEQLSNLFTKDRAHDFGAYAQSEELLLAYGLYIFPQTHHRMQLIWKELASLGPLPGVGAPHLRLLDLGCGSGAASAATLRFFTDRDPAQSIQFQGYDQSKAALNLCHYLLNDASLLWPQVRWKLDPLTMEPTVKPRPATEPYHVIVSSFALGEIFYDNAAVVVADWLHSYQDALTPDGLFVLLEPALSETSVRLMTVRDLLLARGWTALAPCPHQAACPMLSEGKHWCHEVRTWTLPPSLQRLNQHLKRSVHELKYSFLALRPPQAPPLPARDQSRLVAPLAKVHGRYVTRVCAPSGQLEEIEIMTRVVDVPERRRFDKIKRGDWVRLTNPKPLPPPHSYRLPLASDIQKVDQG